MIISRSWASNTVKHQQSQNVILASTTAIMVLFMIKYVGVSVAYFTFLIVGGPFSTMRFLFFLLQAVIFRPFCSVYLSAALAGSSMPPTLGLHWKIPTFLRYSLLMTWCWLASHQKPLALLLGSPWPTSASTDLDSLNKNPKL